MRSCERCGRDFEPRNNQRFCDSSCRKAHKVKSRSKKNMKCECGRVLPVGYDPPCYICHKKHSDSQKDDMIDKGYLQIQGLVGD